MRHDWGRGVSTRGLEDTAALLDEKWSSQVNERGWSSEKTAAAKLDYRLGLVVAAEELKKAVSGACALPSGSRNLSFMKHGFRPGKDGRDTIEVDVMGADVHHAAMAAALIREVDRSALAKGPTNKVWKRCYEKLRASTRGAAYRIESTITRDACPALLLRHKKSSTLVVAVAPTRMREWFGHFRATLRRPSSSVRAALRLQSGECVHPGWAGIFEELAPKVRDKIKAARAAERKKDPHAAPLRVVFSGYSQGGAMATLLAVAMGSSQQRATLVTFGAPRVGNAAFQDTARRRTQHSRVAVAGDCVPLLPTTFCAQRGAPKYAPADASRHWTLGDSNTRPWHVSKGSKAKNGKLLVLKQLLSGLKCHKLDVYLQYIVHHYDKLAERRK